ncbi:hypothetical protein GIB67_043003 [Kingdonia uniflora]|uniref:Alcohol dehydrogenase-like C-terminal domain-containing protein n=1 Tax=Kingdonia uniflora TaxID=39325 RepID=A0A7J7NT91_9MAGN|nr:hypothetical protein GIB67_043003 [Kingdonia uniflora]
MEMEKPKAEKTTGKAIRCRGDNVEKVKEGDIVVPFFFPNCEECVDCKSGKSNVCSKFQLRMNPGMPRDGTSRFTSSNGEILHNFLSVSTFVEYTVVDIVNVVKLGHDIPVDKACLLSCGISTGIGAAWKVADVQEGSTVVIFGLGAVGLAVAEGARLRGASKIIGVDLNPEKFEIGKKFGLTDFVNPKDLGEKAASEGWGKTVILGVEMQGAPLSVNSYHILRGRTITGSLFGGIKAKLDIPLLAKSYLDKELNLDAFITHEVGFSDINKAFDLLIQGKNSCYLEQSRGAREIEAQHQMAQLQEDIKTVKGRLVVVEEERDRALDELREMKKVAETATVRLSEALSAKVEQRETPRVRELEQASIESAKKRDQAWQLELESVQKQHGLDVDVLSSVSQELERVRKELVLALKAKDSRNMADANSKNVADLSAELNSVKESLAAANRELEIKERSIEDVKQIKAELSEKETSLEKMKQDLGATRESESRVMGFLSESKQQVKELQLQAEKQKDFKIEMENAKESETKMFESLLSQTKEQEQLKALLAESHLEVDALQKKVESLEESFGKSSKDLDVSHSCLEKAKLDNHTLKETVDTLKLELQTAKESLARSQEGEELASLKGNSSKKEISMLRTELKLAIEAEEKSKKAMDDLALVLIEVSTEANEVKEKLGLAQYELKNAREDADHSKQIVTTTKEKLQALLDLANKELDQVKSVAERLRFEAEDSIFAWNEKELEFVNCIKRAEEESTASKQENLKLREALKATDDMPKLMREENSKLRDILKQALNEASLAKEAAEIARCENSELKDELLDKDDVLQKLTQENDRLRLSEGAAHQNIKELKKLFSTKSKNLEDRDLGVFQKQNSINYRDITKRYSVSDVLSLKFEELKIPNGHKDEGDEDPEKTEMLKGSIFDVVDSPETQLPNHRKTPSLVFTDEGETMSLEDFDHLGDGSSQRKKKALLRRFGDLIRNRNFHKRESSNG